MNKLKLPSQLEGRWSNVVFLTYRVDLPFFERAIWRILDSRCRNIIIIGDGNRLLDSYKGYSDTLNVRWVNQKYIVDGVFGTTFHPKMIFLTSQKAGRLLIGSGNLGIQGYASGGEMFVQYEYDSDSGLIEYPPVFVFVRNYLEGLIKEGLFRPQTERQLRKLLEETPWLYHGLDRDSVLRSNIEVPFIDQFVNIIGDEPVEELSILSPFYDEKVSALQTILEVINPKITIVYLQEGETSVDPKELESVANQFPGKVRTHLVEIFDGGVYIHNKLYIAKTATKSVCLQGSPNLTRSAFLLCPPQGNFELANLLIGEPDEFDQLIEILTIHQQVENFFELDCKYFGRQDDEVIEGDSLIGCWLVGGEWQKDYLKLFFRGQLPDLELASLLIGSSQFPLKITKTSDRLIEIEININIKNYLERNLPVQIIWPTENRTNPIFPCSLDELGKTIEVDDGDHLASIGDLQLEDKELESLLHELDNSLIIDKQSVNSIWQAIDSSAKNQNLEDGGIMIDYSEIDYEMLRSHPKLAQYREWRIGGRDYRKTRLQIILSSITSHFQGLTDTAAKVNMPIVSELSLEELDDDLAQEDAQEVEEQEAEREKRRSKGKARIRNIMKAFILRYLRGITSTEFLKLVDYDVIANNYVIFLHVLWCLYGLDWIEDNFVTDAFLKMFRFMWGREGKLGYYQSLDQEAKDFCAGIFENGKAVGRMIAAIFYADYLAVIDNWIDVRFELRNFWRHFMEDWPIALELNAIQDAWYLIGHILVYDPPTPLNIIERLQELAKWETSNSFLRAIESTFGLSENSIQFSLNPVRVMRPALGEQLLIQQIEFRDQKGISKRENAETVCQLWMKFQPKEFYRIISVDKSILFLYDSEFKKGLYINHNENVDEEILELKPLKSTLLETRLLSLKEYGVKANELVRVNQFSSVSV